jgi:hypothetical protein
MMPKSKNIDSIDSNKNDNEEYGVVLKNKRYKRRIYPQKGKKPSKDEDSYKTV